MYKDFNKIYDEFHPKVLNFVNVRLSNNLELAYELTNDIFIKVYNNLNSFDDSQAKLSTWIFTIARNTIIDQYRKNANDKLTSTMSNESSGTNWLYNIISNDNFESDYNIVNSELSKKIIKAINKLPSNMKTICVLRFLSDYTYDEIAHELNMSLGTVKGTIFRAKEMLKKSLEFEYANLY